MAKLFQTRLKIEEQSIDIIPFDPRIVQGSTTPILSDIRVMQGSTTPLLAEAKIVQGQSAVLKTIEINPNQGSIEITPMPPIRYNTEQQISLDTEKAQLDYLVLRQSNLLDQNLPAILPTLSPGLSTIPLVPNTQFAKAISLENRFLQSNLARSTTGLSQFFLSDFYVGVLPDISYSFLPNQGGIVIQSLLFTPNQGQITISNIQFTPIQGEVTIGLVNFTPDQGSVVINVFSFIPNQGTTVINGVVYSIIGIPPFDFLPNQGDIIITPYGFIPNQDAQTTVTQPISLDQILLGQGVVTDLAGNLVSFIVPQLITAAIEQGSVTITVPQFNPEQGSVTITESEFTLVQGSTTPDTLSVLDSYVKAFTKPKEIHGEANLNILGYELDRLLARGLPEVKHGSTINGIFNFQELFIPIQLVNNNISTNPVIGGAVSTNFTPQFDVIVQGDLLDPIDKTYNARALVDDGVDLLPNTKDKLLSYLNTAYNRAGQSHLLRERNTQRSQEPQRKSDGEKRSAIDFSGPLGSGYIKFSITSLQSGQSLSFKPYLTAFSDNWSPQFTDVKYVGRQDIQKVFSSVTRTVSVGFKVAAVNSKALKDMYIAVNSLIQATSVGTYGNPYIIGPTLKVTIGDYLTNTPCVATSLKIDTNPTEYPWEISDGSQGTQFLDISMELFILADNNNNIFRSTGKFISI